MKKLLSWIAIPAAALAVALVVGQPKALANWGDDGRDCAGAHPRVAKFTGSWLVSGAFGNPFELVYKLSADGGVAASNGLYINADSSPSYVTTAFGEWKRTGLGTMAAMHLIRIVGDDGQLEFYEKIVTECTIEDGVLTGEAMGIVYLASQNPLDPEEVPILVLGPSPVVGLPVNAETLDAYKP